MYNSKFVTEPFTDMVKGKWVVFNDMEYISSFKSILENNGISIELGEAFISSLEGWVGAYYKFPDAEGLYNSMRTKYNLNTTETLNNISNLGSTELLTTSNNETVGTIVSSIAYLPSDDVEEPVEVMRVAVLLHGDLCPDDADGFKEELRKLVASYIM